MGETSACSELVMVVSGIRLILAVIIGLVATTLIAEGVEVALVASSAGGVPTDPAIYFLVRNQTPILIAKLFSNGAAAYVAGYMAASIAGRRERGIGVALAVVHGLLFVIGMSTGEYAGSMPAMWWIGVLGIMCGAFIYGAAKRGARQKKAAQAA